jgi:hypothetical protein
MAGKHPKLTVPWRKLKDRNAIVAIPMHANGDPKGGRFMKQTPVAYSPQLYR